MRAALAKRLANLEPRPIVIDVPHVVTVARDETAADALARFRTEHVGRIALRHGLIVVPAQIETLEEEAAFEVAFFAQQTKSVADARSAPLKEPAQ